MRYIQTEGVNCRFQDADYRSGGGGGGGGGVHDERLQMGGCRMQVACKYRSFMPLGKVKKIRNLGCSCPGSDLSRDPDRA